MGAARVCARHDLRRHWRSHLALGVLVAIVGGTVLAVTAGAHRTSTSFDRFLTYSNPADVFVSVGPSDEGHLDQVAALPQVDHFDALYQYAIQADSGDVFVPFGASVDGTIGIEFGRPRILEGRLPTADAADEMAINTVQSDLLGVGVGDTLTAPSFAPDQMDALRGGDQSIAPEGPTVTLQVVGITVDPSDVGRAADDPGVAVLTPAFDHAYHDRIGTFVGYLFAATLVDGADVDTFMADAQAVYGETAQLQLQPTGTIDAPLRSSLRVLTFGLLLFAAAVVLAGVVALALATTRQAGTEADADAVRRDLGMTRWSRVATLTMPMTVVAVGGALAAVTIAAAVSARFPIGLARQLEPDPGTSIDVPILVAGAALIALVMVGLATLASARVVARAGQPDRAALGSSRPRSLASAAASTGFGPTVVTGVRLATEPGRGRTAVPVRPAMLGAVLGVTGLVATLVFSATLDQLVSSPERWGWSWDVSFPDTDTVRAGLTAQRDDIDAMADAAYVPVVINGDAVNALGLAPTKGSIDPVVVAGRPPRGPDEVVLGADTLARENVAIGDIVTAESPSGPQELSIVGRGVFPSVEDRLPLADGAALTLAGIERLDDPENPQGVHRVVVRWRDAADSDAATAAVSTAGDEDPQLPRLPAEVERVTQVDRLPELLAGFLVLLAVLAVGHATLTLTTRRRAELGMLATIGFVRRQLRSTLGWQSATAALIGLVLGIPAGIIVGRLAWVATAASLGVAEDITVPTRLLLLTALVTLALLSAVGLVAGARVGRRHPALALRAE